MPRSPASRKREPPKAEERPAEELPPLKADLPLDVLALIDVPASPEEEEAVRKWIRGEGPDPWGDSD